MKNWVCSLTLCLCAGDGVMFIAQVCILCVGSLNGINFHNTDIIIFLFSCDSTNSGKYNLVEGVYATYTLLVEIYIK